MATRTDRVQIFQDTMNWIQSDPALAASVKKAKQNTTVFYEDDYPQFDATSVKEESITVTKNRSSNQYAAVVGNGTCMNQAELFGYHVKRAIHMLTVAASKGADILVLGAFGCGAFENDPRVVARAYKTALEEFPDVFRKIEFAVYCSPQNQENYEAFQKAFED